MNVILAEEVISIEVGGNEERENEAVLTALVMAKEMVVI